MWRPVASFQNALASFCLIGLSLASVPLGFADGCSRLCVESFRVQILEQRQWFRLWTHQLVLQSSALLFCCCWLFSHLRHVERCMGTRRFCMLLVAVFILHPFVLVAIALVLDVDPFAGTSGPLCILFALVFVHISQQQRTGLDVTWLVALQAAVVGGGLLQVLCGKKSKMEKSLKF
jgi:membrane associated rhomboid family serine protease